MASFETDGPWRSEEEAGAAFDAIAAADYRFGSAYAEVSGIYTLRTPFQPEQAPRIDRILTPSQELLDAGWTSGPIGVEIKAPGKKLGPVVAQCIDYARAAFEVKPGFWVVLGHVAVFHCPPVRGCLESVMVQERVLACRLSFDQHLTFWRGGTQVCSLTRTDRNALPLRKVGSR